MNSQEVTTLIRQELNNFANKAQFGVSPILHHKHTGGSDGPQINYASLLGIPNQQSYAGTVDSGGTAVLLPSGWSAVQNGTGDYTVSHNLGTVNYGVGATINTNDLSSFRAIISIAAISAGSFQVLTGNVSSGSGVGVGFTFVLHVQS